MGLHGKVQALSHWLVTPMQVRVLISVVLLALLAGCSSAPRQGSEGMHAPAARSASTSVSRTVSPSKTYSTHAPSVRTLPPVNEDIVFHAIGLVGTPYRYGGSSPETGFDCSGLIKYVYQQAVGMSLPRTTAGLNALAAKNPPVGSLQPGDLVLFAMNGGKRVDHAGIYVGDGRFLHAPSSGGKVRVDDMQSNFWQRTYTGARRVLK
nr:C40 family peptidase [Halopseudomonas pelagia]